ncbi:MAG: hypothetical protein QOK45_1725 [Mycobacterium sp.]|jgi:hypothetical protein|nr:hypothetical protein [Mycobacterium sp.]
MIEILDGLLLVFIFVELLYAVRSCMRSHEIVAGPFLIVGILAGTKEIVVLSVAAATLLDSSGIGRFRASRAPSRHGRRGGGGGSRTGHTFGVNATSRGYYLRLWWCDPRCAVSSRRLA